MIQPAKIRRSSRASNQDLKQARLAVLDGPNTAYVEALRGLRTSLLLSRDGAPSKTILITSAAEKEGKSTLSLNLAAVLALNGSRVLLVDADMRSAGLSGYMGFARQTTGLIEYEPCGLSDALSGSGEPGSHNAVSATSPTFGATRGINPDLSCGTAGVGANANARQRVVR